MNTPLIEKTQGSSHTPLSNEIANPTSWISLNQPDFPAQIPTTSSLKAEYPPFSMNANLDHLPHKRKRFRPP